MTAKPSPASATDFLSNLNDECATLKAFVVLLEDEQRTLLGQHTEELLSLADAKIQLANKVATLSAARRRFLPEGTRDMAEWLKKNAPQGLPTWHEARQLAAQVQRLNQTNGELIQIKLRYNQQALGVLYGAVQSTAGLYGADGQPNQPSASRTLGSV
ncbi:MAG: flagellar protein FlgN [Nitrosomonadales bacterium]|nr:flagellar protein FlgN [Nitrosomonadales bacterium]